jgi:hypothetical protein
VARLKRVRICEWELVGGVYESRGCRDFAAKSGVLLERLIYMSYPYGSWFLRELLSSGRVRVCWLAGELTMNQPMGLSDREVKYEIVDVVD